MADYQSLKVPELKKLLNERGLPQTGNKADLIARLQENDKLTSAEEIPGKPWILGGTTSAASTLFIFPWSAAHRIGAKDCASLL